MITINPGFIAGAMYAPFCRTKSAPMEEWDKDLKTMKELGFSCVHGFAEWHDIEYEKGRFDFTQVDYFVECAFKNGLIPIVNVATQNSVGFYSPRWLMEEYRGIGEGYVDSLGKRVMQGEYVVPCLDDPLYKVYADRYLAEVAKHFAGDERIGGYVLWGEPNIFSPCSPGSVICYCRHTQAKFCTWLKEHYGTIDKLNEAWGTEGSADYVDFSQIHPPTGWGRQLGGFASWEDWREFMEWNLASHIQNADRIFKENGATQPTITEMLTGINNGIDSWKLSEGTDIVGISLFDMPTKRAALHMSVSDSIAKALDKSTFVVEAAGGTVKFGPPSTQTAKELKSALLMRAGYGIKGLMYWCWRPRLSDTEGNDFGMCRPDGKYLKRTKEIGILAKRMNELSHVYNSAKRKSDVAIFMSQKINHLMGAESMTDNYLNSLIGAHNMMADLHINSDFISEKEIIKGSLGKYKVLILSCAYIMSEECASKIADFVKNGGKVIADYILAEKKPGGFCYTSLPGGGLDKVFGIDKEDALYIAHPTMLRENTFGIDLNTMVEEINLNTAKSIEDEYKPGYPLVTENIYGDGTAIYIATQYFARYASNPLKVVRDRISGYLEKSGIMPSAIFENEDNKDYSPIISTTMYDENNSIKIFTATNTDYYPICDTLVLPEGEYESIDTASDVTFENKDGKCYVNFNLDAFESFAVYRK